MLSSNRHASSNVELNKAQQLVLQAQGEVERAIRVAEYQLHGTIAGAAKPPLKTDNQEGSKDGIAAEATAAATDATASSSPMYGVGRSPMLQALKMARRNLAHAVRLTFRVLAPG